MTTIEFNNQLILMESNLLAFSRRFVKTQEEANDLLQDTFVKAISNREKFNDDTNLKAWLYTIMKNTFINNYRRNNKKNSIMMNAENITNLSDKKKVNFLSPLADLEYKELRKRLEQIKPDYREAFMMHFEGYKYQEIADHLEIPIGTVKTRIFHARNQLTSLLSKEG